MTVSRVIYMGVVGIGAAMISGTLSYLYYKLYYKKRYTMPSKWRRVGVLQQINIFPVKSCAPSQLSPTHVLECGNLGLRCHGIGDRTLMLIDENNDAVTARRYPKMVLIETKLIDEGRLQLSAAGMETLVLEFSKLIDEAPGHDVHTTLWGVQVDGMLCGKKYDEWFSRFLLNKDNGIKLIYYPYSQPVKNIVKDLSNYPFLKQEDTGAFNDATSYMLMNLSSVDNLNTRLDRPVDALQFRGNFHLKMDTPVPYAEDKWQWVRIGDDVVFRVVAPCTRCIFPNINVETGERDPDGEPLKTLKRYRLITKLPSPALGIHLGIRQHGSIKLNDVIYVEDDI